MFLCRSTAAAQLHCSSAAAPSHRIGPGSCRSVRGQQAGSEGGSVVPTRKRPDASKASPQRVRAPAYPPPPCALCRPTRFPVRRPTRSRPLCQEVLTGPRAGTIKPSGDATLHYNSRLLITQYILLITQYIRRN